MQEAVFFLFNKPIMPYALVVACATFLAVTLYFLLTRREEISLSATQNMTLLSLVLGLACGHMLYIALQHVYEFPSRDFFQRLLDPTSGGYMFYGVVGGIVLSAFLVGLTQKRTKASTLLNALAPSLMLFIALCRFAEILDGQGMGLDAMEEWTCFFPLAFWNAQWEVWQFAVFFYEGLYALCIFAYSLTLMLKKRGKNLFVQVLILYATGQILFETLRRDVYVNWGFIRLSQLISLLILLGALLYATVHYFKRAKKQFIWSWIGSLLLTGAAIALEFTVDKPLIIGDLVYFYFPYWLTYSLIALCALSIGTIAWCGLKKGNVIHLNYV